MESSSLSSEKIQLSPLVSVCVQTYQHSKFIEVCLESILKQKTKFPFEIILGEDESTDGTREICINYAEKYPEIIKLFLRNRKDVITINGKPTGRFNFLQNLKASKGKYIALCEGDDYWTDIYKLQKQIDFLESNLDYSICFHKVKILKNNELIEDYITVVPAQNTTIIDLAKRNYIHTPSCMFRGGVEIPEWFKSVVAGDYALHMLNAMRGKIHCMNDTMAVYRIHTGGMWSTNEEAKNQLIWLGMLTTMCEHFDGDVLKVLMGQRLRWAIHLHKSGFKKETESLLKENHLDVLQNLEVLMDETLSTYNNPKFLAEKVSFGILLKALIYRVKRRLNK